MTRRRHHRRPPTTYSLMSEMLASPIQPTPADLRNHQLTRMWQGLASIETAPAPTPDDWRVCSDAVNLFETLVSMSPIHNKISDTVTEVYEVADTRGLLLDAVAAMAMAGQRHQRGGAIRLDGKGIQAIRAVLEDYAAMLDQLPHRIMVRCHRLTEKRIYAIHAGRKQPHDVEVTAL